MNDLERFLNWCRKPIKTLSTRFKKVILPISVSILFIFTLLILRPFVIGILGIPIRFYSHAHIDNVIFNKDLEGNPVSITVYIKNPGIKTTITSLTINESECVNIEPKLPITLKTNETVEIVVPYEWRLETYYSVDINYEAGGGHGGCGVSADTWTKPIIMMRILDENKSIFVGENVDFSLFLQWMKCPFGYGRSLKPVGLVTTSVVFQSPSGSLERVEIERTLNIHGFGRSIYSLDYTFNETGEWNLEFQSESDEYGVLADLPMTIEVLESGFTMDITATNKERHLKEIIPHIWDFTSPIPFYEGSKVTAYGNTTIDFNIEIDWRKLPPLRGELSVEVVDFSLTNTTYQIRSIEVNDSGSTGIIEWWFNVTKAGQWLFDFKLILGDTVRDKIIRIDVLSSSLVLSTGTTKEYYNIGEIVGLYIKKTEINIVRKTSDLRYFIETKSPLGLITSKIRRAGGKSGSDFYISENSTGRYGFPHRIVLMPGVYEVTVKLLSDREIIALATTKFTVNSTPSIPFLLFILISSIVTIYLLKKRIKSTLSKSHSYLTVKSKLEGE